MSYRYILFKGFFPSGYVCGFFSMVSASWETVKHRRIKDGNRRQGKGHRFGLADLREVWVSLVLLSFWRKSRFKRSAKPCCVRLQLQPRFLLTKKLLPWVFPIPKTTALGSSYLKQRPRVLPIQKTSALGLITRVRKQRSRVLSTGNNGFWFYFRGSRKQRLWELY